MKLTTLATEDWRHHVDRFTEHATAVMPDCHVQCLYQPDDRADDYLYFDRLRMSLPSIIGGETVYYDPDVDIIRDVSDITAQGSESLLWVRSPVPIPGVQEVCDHLGLPAPAVHANIGCLVIREDLSTPWAVAEERCLKLGLSGKLAGSIIFNVMLAMRGPGAHVEIPYSYDVRWNDVPDFPTAKAIHFCNDHGKAMRPYFRYGEGGEVSLRA